MTRAQTVWLCIAVAACNPDRGPKFRPAGNRSPRDGGALRFAMKDGVRSLDPTIEYDEVSSVPVHLLFDTLVDYEPSSADDPAIGLKLIPRLAESWDISSDGLTYSFTLRPDLKYSDGTPVVADDFKYSLERALRTADSPFGPFLTGIVGAQEFKDNISEVIFVMITASVRRQARRRSSATSRSVPTSRRC